MDKKVGIIVPYRDRRDELDVFLPHMEEFLENKNIDYKIFSVDSNLSMLSINIKVTKA